MTRKIVPLLAWLLLILTGARAQQQSLLWEITGKGLLHPSYLFGTIHMICPEDFYLSQTAKNSFAKTKTVYMELDLENPSAASLKLMGLLQFKNGKKLSDLFDSADYKDLGKFVRDSMQMDIRFFQPYKPLMLYGVLSSKMLPCSAEQAYETKFLEMAKQAQKPVKGLETIEEQVSIFDSIPGKEQANMIMDMVRHYDSQKLDFQRMVAFYKAQQLDSLFQMLQESPDTKINQDLLLNDRNKKWIPLITAAMNRGPSFIAVGAGHLGGPEGLISLLKKKGYTVKPIL